MSKQQAASGGSDQNPGGASEETQNTTTDAGSDDSESTEQTKGKVAYATYLKAVDEAKAAKRKLSEFEKSKREAEEAKLAEQGEYKKLLEQREAELKAEKEARQKLDSQISDSRKIRAFVDAVVGEVPKQYWGLIDLEKIAVNPETGQPDEASVKKAARDFEKQYPDVVKKRDSSRLPDDAAKGGKAAVGFEAEIRSAKSQKEFDAVMVKYGKM